MFGLLKKKISGFIEKLTKREEDKGEPEQHEKKEEPELAIKPEEQARTTEQHEKTGEKPIQPIEKTKPAIKPEEHPARTIEQPERVHKIEAPKPIRPEKTEEKPAPKEQIRQTPIQAAQQPQQETKVQLPQPTQGKPVLQQPKERELAPKLGLVSKVKSFFVREVEIKESEIAPLLDELHWAMLESDVSLDTAEHITQRLKEELTGKKIEKDKLNEKLRESVKRVLTETLSSQTLDLTEYIHAKGKPVKILFLGPNGAGKTTTIAKVAHYLKSKGISSVLAASDTFRAAAIEQISHHGEKLDVRVIKHDYAADPSAVAFDAIAHAKAKGIDVVLIDTAGRQETNYNLLKEMEKINRVVNPDLKLFVGEAVAGHAIVEQAKAFNDSLHLDGIILTKLDCDAKGGTSFSLGHELRLPIVFMGCGQGYDDLKKFDAEWIVSNVLAE
ncbi:signal recognition particle-docking protein FtsY [Candidatus Micrarchaeota archaeon]|nr:signal recognition particle-docking protein FtsY [Candidatus Micrarchaeota archaeon]